MPYLSLPHDAKLLYTTIIGEQEYEVYIRVDVWDKIVLVRHKASGIWREAYVLEIHDYAGQCIEALQKYFEMYPEILKGVDIFADCDFSHIKELKE